MKIAYFSPFPPKQTGIATYSIALVKELRRLMRVDCFDFENGTGQDPSVNFADFDKLYRIGRLKTYDATVYHLGNNPHFHLDIYRTLRQFPGIVVLHDIVLYFLFAGDGKAAFVKHFLINYGVERIHEIDDVIRQSDAENILRYNLPEK